MKFLLALALVASSAFAKDEVLLTCTRTHFTDLDKIVITAGESEDQIVVTEIDEQGRTNVTTQSVENFKSLDIELSSWYGYSRRLYKDKYGWNIEHHDECSGGVGVATCE